MTHKILQTIFSAFLLGLCTVSFSHANTITFDTRLDTTFTGYTTYQRYLQFNYGGNNFEGMVFPTAFTGISPAVDIVLPTATMTGCDRQIQGLYYNNARGLRIRPLDTTTLAKLQTINPNYSNITLSGGLFYNCANSATGNVYGQITITLYGQEYKIVAGTTLQYATNTYTGTFAPTLEVANNRLSGSIFDNYGGIGTLGRVQTQITSGHILLQTPQKEQVVQRGIISFARGAAIAGIESYQFVISPSSTFASNVTVVDVSTGQATYTTNTTGTLYWKVIAKDVDGLTGQSEIRTVHVEIPTSDDYPDAFTIEIPEKATAEKAIPLRIVATRGKKVVTNYNGDILIDVLDENGNEIDADIYTVPYDGLFSFTPLQKGVLFDPYTLRITKTGKYTIQVRDMQFSSFVGSKNIEIQHATTLGFIHEHDIQRDTRIVSKAIIIPPSFAKNTRITLTEGDIIVDGVHKGGTAMVEPGDSVQIAIQSPTTYDTAKTVLITIGREKYTFGVTTKVRNESDKNDIFATQVPELSTSQKKFITDYIHKLLERVRKQGYDIRTIKMKALFIIQKQEFLIDGNIRSYYNQRIINREKFKRNVFANIKKAFQEYIVPKTTTTTIACSDTDGGLNYSVKGTGKGIYIGFEDDPRIFGTGNNPTTISRSQDSYSTYYDYCQDAKQLNEAFCKDGKLSGMAYSCTNGCYNGACK